MAIWVIESLQYHEYEVQSTQALSPSTVQFDNQVCQERQSAIYFTILITKPWQLKRCSDTHQARLSQDQTVGEGSEVLGCASASSELPGICVTVLCAWGLKAAVWAQSQCERLVMSSRVLTSSYASRDLSLIMSFFGSCTWTKKLWACRLEIAIDPFTHLRSGSVSIM